MAIEKRVEMRGDAVCRPFALARDRWARLVLVAGISVGLTACGQSSDHPPVYPLEGKVLFKGKPIAGGVVVFELEGGAGPADANTPQSSAAIRATGRIQEGGKFRLQAFAGTEGVPAGTYKVGISSMPPRTEAGLFGGSTVKKGDPDVLHGRYSDPKTSGLKFDVVADKPNEPVFDLK